MPTETQTNETNVEIETQPVTVETKLSRGSRVHSLNHYVLFHLKNNFLFHLFF